MRNLVGQHLSVPLALLTVGNILEYKEHPMGVIAGLRNLSRVEVENTAAQPRKIILDLEILDRLVFRKYFVHQMAKRRDIPLVLAQFGNAPAKGLRLRTSEYGQERLARSHNRQVIFENDQGIADRVHNALRELPVALAFFAGGAFLADILDGKQNGAVIIARTEYLAGVDQHRALTDCREIMLDLEPFDRGTVGDHALKQRAQRRDIPLPVSEIVNKTALGLFGIRAKRLIEGAIGRSDVEIPVENDERAGHGFNNVARSNIRDCHISSSISQFKSAILKLCCEQAFKRSLKLILGIGLRQEV
jgi:hypothetical protein